MRWILLGLVLALGLEAQPKRILYVTHSAGFRHGSLPVSADVMRSVAAASGKLEVIATEDVSLLNAANLRGYDAVFFFTSGDLPISGDQKRDLLDFIRSGKGFGGAHSATDTFYSWPDYGEMIGGYFNGHPWVQEAAMDVEDSRHPATAHFTPGPMLLEEYYQFRQLSREKVRVLLSLNPASVDLTKPDVNPNTRDFPLAWVRNYGSGRVFYTALGHFDETWRDERFQRMLLGAMLWITGQADGDATPRPERKPALAAEGIGNAASFTPRMTLSPGSIVSIFGTNLTDGRTEAAADLRAPPTQLAGTALRLNSQTLPLFYASPSQINAYVPLGVPINPCPGICKEPYFNLEVLAGGGSTTEKLRYAQLTPGIFTATADRSYATLWATGLGPVERRGQLDFTLVAPTATVGGMEAGIQFSGLAPGWLGLYQVNIAIPPGTAFPARVELLIDGLRQSAFVNAP